MSILDWINESVPGGAGSKLGQLLEVAYTIEYGADASQQSALNLLYLLGFSGLGQLRIFGPPMRSTPSGTAATRSRPGSPPSSKGRSRPASSWSLCARAAVRSP
jgi:hypothetical protein